MEHSFTVRIRAILNQEFGAAADDVFQSSPLLQYLNIKTRSADRGSKSRASFASLYAVYVLIEDYVNRGYPESGKYAKYEGARFTDLLDRQRKLPFGRKLQNHALNSRMNEEFKRFFPDCSFIPILRNTATNRYWFNEHLLQVKIAGKKYKLARIVLAIIDAYIAAKQGAFEGFIKSCEDLQKLNSVDLPGIKDFIVGLLQANVDARIFEIVSFAILKHYYSEQVIYWGWSPAEITEETLALFKTGRTNANDGGIDFVMKPLGRFFQVTETTDVKKYFLDIDKVQRFPITFVVKSILAADELASQMKAQAKTVYGVDSIVDAYMHCVEEIIAIPQLLDCFNKVCERGKTSQVLDEISLYSRVEFNYQAIEDASGD